jgi:hypothetical protein
MASVHSPDTKEVVGIVTLEDIIEELIQEEIMDEADLAYEYTKKAEKLMKQAEALRKGISLSEVKRKQKRTKISRRSNSTGMHRSVSEDNIPLGNGNHKSEQIVQLMSEEELTDHLRSSAPTSPVLHREDEDIV